MHNGYYAFWSQQMRSTELALLDAQRWIRFDVSSSSFDTNDPLHSRQRWYLWSERWYRFTDTGEEKTTTVNPHQHRGHPQARVARLVVCAVHCCC